MIEQSLQNLGIDTIDMAVINLYPFEETIAKNAEYDHFSVMIAGAGGSAHLPGMISALTSLPVLGVPIESKKLKGLDSLLSIVQMPKGIPVGTLAIGEDGAINAALLAASIIGNNNQSIKNKLNIIFPTVPPSSQHLIDIKDFFLNNPMQRYEYARIPIRWIPADIMEKHNLQEKIHNGYVYVEICKGMYCLKQAARLAYERLVEYLRPHSLESKDGVNMLIERLRL